MNLATDSVTIPQCEHCGMRHPAVALAFPGAKPDPFQCIEALAEMVTGLTMALAGNFRPLNAVMAKYYGQPAPAGEG